MSLIKFLSIYKTIKISDHITHWQGSGEMNTLLHWIDKWKVIYLPPKKLTTKSLCIASLPAHAQINAPFVSFFILKNETQFFLKYGKLDW